MATDKKWPPLRLEAARLMVRLYGAYPAGIPLTPDERWVVPQLVERGFATTGPSGGVLTVEGAIHAQHRVRDLYKETYDVDMPQKVSVDPPSPRLVDAKETLIDLRANLQKMELLLTEHPTNQQVRSLFRKTADQLAVMARYMGDVDVYRWLDGPIPNPNEE